MAKKPSKISIIVTTYNWPYALRLVLQALLSQKNLTIPYEIIIADDGSNKETADVIASIQKKALVSVSQVWQKDEGFRVAAIRNKAVLKASGDYLIFIDGDCIASRNFIKRHFQLAEEGFFVSGNRVLLSREFTIAALSEMLPLHQWSLRKWFFAWMQGYCNRLLPFLTLPLGRFRFINKNRWQGAKGCNLGLWKEDFMRVNGFEEQFVGWGYEDSDLLIRLFRLGIKRKEGRYAVPVVHLWHPENDRSTEESNLKRLISLQKNDRLQAVQGLNQYATE